eukprot:scaffold69739_cov30-Tisochrysis_lutea.AAC.2
MALAENPVQRERPCSFASSRAARILAASEVNCSNDVSPRARCGRRNGRRASFHTVGRMRMALPPRALRIRIMLTAR